LSSGRLEQLSDNREANFDTKLDKDTQVIGFKYRRCIENPRVGGSIPPLGTMFTLKSVAYALVDLTKITSNT
jgi:hypothetical protein